MSIHLSCSGKVGIWPVARSMVPITLKSLGYSAHPRRAEMFRYCILLPETAAQLGRGRLMRLMLNEWMTDTPKHAFPDNGTGMIPVALRAASARRLSLGVADNGSAMPTDPDHSGPDSLGLQLVRTLVAHRMPDLSGNVHRDHIPDLVRILVIPHKDSFYDRYLDCRR